MAAGASPVEGVIAGVASLVADARRLGALFGVAVLDAAGVAALGTARLVAGLGAAAGARPKLGVAVRLAVLPTGFGAGAGVEAADAGWDRDFALDSSRFSNNLLPL